MFKVFRTAGNILKPQSDSNIHGLGQDFGEKSPTLLPRTFFGKGFIDQQLSDRYSVINT
jgi:hypothetical protein